MQAIKAFQITDSDTSVIKRPYYPGATNSNYWTGSDQWNEQIAEFLSLCGVNAVWGINESIDPVYKYLYIDGIPTLFRKSDVSDYLFFVIGNHNTFYNNGATYTENAKGYLSFVGNPKGPWCLRFLYENMSIDTGFFYGYVSILATNERLISYFTYGGTAATLYKIVDGIPKYVNSSYIIRNTAYDSSNSIYKAIVGDEIVLPKAVLNVAAPTLSVDNMYLFPREAGIPNGNSADSLYQKEVIINSKKFLVAWSESGSLSKGLIQLEDDDPLITEEELMVEVIT